MASNCVSDSTFPQNECINVPKIFDQCRIQVCLTPENLGPARLFLPSRDRDGCDCGNRPGGNGHRSNPVVVPPQNATSVTVYDFCIKNISVINKTPSPFRQCYWDVTVKFTFIYTLKFFDSENCEISCTKAYSTYTTTLSLFGGDDINTAIYNELFRDMSGNGPFITVEGSAMTLAASLHYPSSPIPPFNYCFCNCCPPPRCDCTQNGCNSDYKNDCQCNDFPPDMRQPYGNSFPPEGQNFRPFPPRDIYADGVDITIGVFAVVKLLRLSNITVTVLGNCMPGECNGISGEAIDPCAFFDGLQFPVDLFAPQANYTPVIDVSGNTKTDGGSCCK